MVPGVYAPEAVDGDFNIRDAYAFPNPARGGRAVTIRVQVGLADSVDIAILDVTGRPVHSGTVSSAVIVNDARGKGAQWTFDYAWDASHVGSGIYTFTATAHKSGRPNIRKTGRLVVLR